ncbi:zinc transporter ZupT [bacterium]|nr:zinc transporter ZupT [bacterium]
MNLPNNIGLAFSFTMLAGLTTAIGGAIAFITQKDNLKALSIGLGFSAGVMIFVSMVDIIPGAENLLKQNFPNSYQWLVFGGFIVGILVSILIDYFLPDHVDTEELLHPDMPPEELEKHNHYKLKRAGMLTAVAICVHNFPEGMATFLTTTQNVTLGFSVALAIAIHNIPEGIAVALPIYHVTGKKRYAMLYAALSGITEPIGALVGMLIFGLFVPQILVGFLMAAVGGIMTYISFDTLLPLAKEYGNWHLSIVGIMSGILFIWLSLILLG